MFMEASAGTDRALEGRSAAGAAGGLAAVGGLLRRRLGALLPSALPPSFGEALATLRRDLHMVTEGLAGRHPPPLIPRSVRSTPAASVLTPRTLRVERVVRETPDAVTLWLRDPAGAPIPFLPGQFFTLIVPVGGQTVRRAYSASGATPDGSLVAITSKRVAGGLLSNHLNDQAQVGMALSVLGPSGSFTVTPATERARRYVLIGGGSGITPLLSITRAVLQDEPRSQVALLFGNRGAADIIFHRELDELHAAHAPRFHLRHVLEQPPAGWTGGTGRLEEAVVARELAALDAAQAGPDSEYLLCGPAPMMAAARAALRARGVAAERIREERFGSPRSLAGAAQSRPTTPQSAELHGPDRVRSITVAPTETLLEAGLRAGAAMPFSCAMGGCGACKVKLLRGEVAMQEPNCLTASEREGGYILACVASPCSPVTVRVP
jgi:ferredoxin-NADP reductase